MQMKRLFEDSWSDPSDNPMSSDEENELDEALVEGVDSDFDDDADYDVVTVDPTVGHVDRSDLSAGSAEQHSRGEESVPPPCLTRRGAAGSARMPQHEERECSPIPERSRSPSPARRQTHGRQPRRARRVAARVPPPCLTRRGAAGSARMPQHEERECSPIPERSRSPSPARRQTHGRQPRRARRVAARGRNVVHVTTGTPLANAPCLPTMPEVLLQVILVQIAHYYT